MLEYLRNAADKPVAKVLIGILAFSFVGWGVAEWVFGGGVRDNTLIRVGGQSITVEQFNMERARQMANLTKEQQKQIYTDAAAAGTFMNTVAATLTNNQLVENRADDLGFVVTDRRIAREIREFPEFQVNGQFSSLLFDTVLNNSGYSEQAFAAFLRGQVLRSMVLGSMSVPFAVPDFAVRAAYNARYAQRKIEYVALPFSDFQVGTPTDAQLAEFYAQNPHVIPETRTVSYVLIPAQMDKPDAYDAAYATAQRVEDDIIGGETLTAAASRHRAKHVSLGAFSADKRPVDAVLTDAMVAKIFAMDEGLESELMETKSGFVIVRVDKVVPAHNAEMADVKKNLVADWKRDQQKKQAYVRANEIVVDARDGGAMPGQKTATVSRTSGAPTDVLVAAFNGNTGDISVVPGTNAFYAVRIVDEIAPQMDTTKMAAVRKELQNMATRNVMDDYNAFLVREYPVKINQKTFDKMFAK
ncbi:MAG: peptidylprolyl isomerase [Alphaproteobacteria bacterium]|nr:peptidylprolyl isomerase [Alphaproteobacteria bacterium]